jgi:hypothetical protein
LRHEQKILEEYAADELKCAEDLLCLYQLYKIEIPDDEYRAVAFFKNREWLLKPGALNELYATSRQLFRELPAPTKEQAFDYVSYRYKVYGRMLEQGGY